MKILQIGIAVILINFRVGAGDIAARVERISTNNFAVHAEAAPELDSLFQQTNGWIGADAAFSTPLSTNRILWLFGDTFIGQAQDGKRTHARMINSTIAIQEPEKAPEFFWKTNRNGEADSFLKPADSQGFLWLGDAARCGNRLHILVQQMRKVNDSVFGFDRVATWLATVTNPDDAPAKWKISQEKLPFQEVNRDKLAFGAAVMKRDGFVYIYGNRSSKVRERRGLIIARAPDNAVTHFRQWEFFDGNAWTQDFRRIATLPVEGISEGSVSWVRSLDKFVLVYNENIWGKIVLRTASTPVGPWSKPVFVYQAPDVKWGPKVFSYAGKAHPEISAPGELVISYAANSMNFPDLFNDARLYWPKFIRVKFSGR